MGEEEPVNEVSKDDSNGKSVREKTLDEMTEKKNLETVGGKVLENNGVKELKEGGVKEIEEDKKADGVEEVEEHKKVGCVEEVKEDKKDDGVEEVKEDKEVEGVEEVKEDNEVDVVNGVVKDKKDDGTIDIEEDKKDDGVEEVKGDKEVEGVEKVKEDNEVDGVDGVVKDKNDDGTIDIEEDKKDDNGFENEKMDEDTEVKETTETKEAKDKGEAEKPEVDVMEAEVKETMETKEEKEKGESEKPEVDALEVENTNKDKEESSEKEKSKAEEEEEEEEDNIDNDKSKEEEKVEDSDVQKKSKKRGRGKMNGEKVKEKRKEPTMTEPRTPTSDRPVRERKSVERLVASIEKDANKEFHIKKGRGTPLKDIPNVAFKLSRRKTDDTFKLLHTILFGRRGKAVQIKSNISRFSGFVWHDNEMFPQQSNNGNGSRSGTNNSVTPNYRTGSIDGNSPLWAYVSLVQNKKEGKGNASWSCNYCNETYKGSYSRVRAHLLKEKGHGIIGCSKVSSEYLAEMKQLDGEVTEKAKPIQVPLPTGTSSLNPPVDGSKKRRGVDGALAKAFNNEARDHLSAEIARLFYSAGLPFNVARNPYFISAFTYAANTSISGFLPPGYNAIRTTMLQREKANILRLLQPIKDTWPEKGVSIVTDGWTDAQRRPLINFMVASGSGPMFLKAIDGTGEYKDKHYIASLILATIDEVGPQNVVQVITDNAPVCKAAGSIVESMHRHIFWTPCVVHTLNLALKNICAPKDTPNNEVVYSECHWISMLADDAFFIKNFIMNHSMRLAMFNQFVDLKLLAIAETRFASIIIMFKRLRTIKHGLQSMVISEQWSHYREDDVQKAASVKETILNDGWWDQVDYVLSFTKPIYDMLRSCDTDKPNLHLVYEKWDSMIEKVKLAIYQHEGKELNQHSTFHEVVYNILIDRWTKSYTPLHCLAHSLNPRYYCRQWLDEAPNRVPPHKDNEICVGRNKCLRNYFADSKERLEATTEFVKFSSAEEELSHFDSLQDRWNLQPKEWWVMYGSSVPKLQSIALKLLSQPCSSSCCERNWSTYSFIHSLKRNKLNPKRAEDLVFVHTNLRLLSRRSKNYHEGETKMWDIGGDEWDPFDGAGSLEVASLSLDEPDLEAILFTDDGQGNNDIETVSV